MKKLIRSLMVITGLLVSMVPAKAVIVTLTATSLNTNYSLVPTNGGIIRKITLNSVGSSATNAFYFRDSPNTNVFWTNPGFTNYSFAITSRTNFYTNAVGALETNAQYNILGRVTNAYGSSNYMYNLLQTMYGSSNTVVVWQPVNPVPFIQGLTVQTTNGSPSTTITVEYDPLR